MSLDTIQTFLIRSAPSIYFMNESYGSVNSYGLWACANILTPKTGTDQTRNTIALFWYS